MKPIKAADFSEPLDRRGRRKFDTVVSNFTRDRLLRLGGRCFFGAMTKREQARQLHTALLRYQTGAWRRDRTELICPERHQGKITEVCFVILRLRDRVPSEGAIRRALAGIPEPRAAVELCDHFKP